MTNVLRPNADEAIAAWAELVRANNRQVERFREVGDGADFYGPVASAFRSDPHRQDDGVLNAVLDLVEPGETWLDIGAGGGRYGLPIAKKAGEVIAVDASEGMLGVLREDMETHGITNVRVINDHWPTEPAPGADVAFIANVGMDVAEIGAFLDAMEATARRLCVAVMGYRQATFVFDKLWPRVHGEERAALPALPEFIILLLARGRMPQLRLETRPAMSYSEPDEALNFVRRQTWVAPGTEKDELLRQLINEALIKRDGRFAFSWEPAVMGIVSWEPR
jgi:SAM-dependent methyltransferase